MHSQEYDGSRNIWHLTTYDGVTGYVLNGQLRKLTEKEVENYLASGIPPRRENPGGNPHNPNGASSYGYITANSVNFRTSPNGSRIKQLNKHAMAMILGTRQVNGVTWYNVTYNGQIGWIHGDYFHQMTLTEFNSFLSSSQYQQGLANNAVATATPKPSTGGSTSGNTSGNKGSATQGKRILRGGLERGHLAEHRREYAEYLRALQPPLRYPGGHHHACKDLST